MSQNYSAYLQNVDAHFGQGYFTTISLMIEAQCVETQAILRASRSDLVAEDAPFRQYIGLIAYAQSLYKKAQGMLLGIPNAQVISQFVQKRLDSVTCAMLYVNATHIASSNPGQALKDAMSAQDYVKNCDLLDFATVQNLITMLMMQTQHDRITAAPQNTNFTPTPIDMSGKYKEWGIEIQIEEDPSLLMVSKQEIDVMKEVVNETRTTLVKTLDQSSKLQQCREFIDQVSKQL